MWSSFSGHVEASLVPVWNQSSSLLKSFHDIIFLSIDFVDNFQETRLHLVYRSENITFCLFFFLPLLVIVHSLNFHPKTSAKSCIDFNFFFPPAFYIRALLLILHWAKFFVFTRFFFVSQAMVFFDSLLLSNLHWLSEWLSPIPWTVLNY